MPVKACVPGWRSVPRSFVENDVRFSQFQHAYIREMAILLIPVQAIPYDKDVRNGETTVVNRDGYLAALRFVQQGAHMHRRRCAWGEVGVQKTKRTAAV